MRRNYEYAVRKSILLALVQSCIFCAEAVNKIVGDLCGFPVSPFWTRASQK